MRYFAALQGQNAVSVEVQPLGPGRFVVTLEGGRRHEVDARTLGPGSLSLLVEGKACDVGLQPSVASSRLPRQTIVASRNDMRRIRRVKSP